MLLYNKQLAGSCVALFKGFDKILKGKPLDYQSPDQLAQQFYCNFRLMIKKDLQNSNAQQIFQEKFYLEKVYDFLSDTCIRYRTNEGLYDICGRDLETVMYTQLMLFVNSQTVSDYESVQVNLLKMLINYIKNCIQQNRSFGNFYYKLKQNDYQ